MTEKLHYITFRYYDPQLGRYTTQDPIGLAGGVHLYQYVPNPLTWIDPWRCSSEQFAENKVNGVAVEDLILDKLSANKNVEVLGRQVYIKLPGFGRGRFVDILIRNKTGQLIAVEVKSGGATRNASLIAKDKVIASGRGKAPTGLADKNATDIIINEKPVPLWRLKND